MLLASTLVRLALISGLALNKSNAQDFRSYRDLFRALREFRPDIVHTRNLGTLEYLLIAAFSRSGARIHGEHGRDVYDPDGLNLKYNLLRRAVRPFVHRYIVVSTELKYWLVDTVGVRSDKVTRICNGVDILRFCPRRGPRRDFGPQGFACSGQTIVGTVGRMEAIKDPLTLVHAFLHLISTDAGARSHLRLAVIGDGALRNEARQLISAAGVDSFVWLPGERNDIPELMRGLDLFVLPSLREGISNMILEAMACGLPWASTAWGAAATLDPGECGIVVPSGSPHELASALSELINNPERLRAMGQRARHRAEADFGESKYLDEHLQVIQENH